MEAKQRLIDNSSKNEILESEYASWFATYVQDPENGITDAYVRDISFGPTRVVTSYDECNANGFVFHTLDHSRHKSTYNCGVLVKGSHVDGHGLDYYGQLLEVIELTYHGSSEATFVLFKCEWFDPVNAVRKHRKFNCLVDVNLARKWRRNNKEPFVFPEQVCQVYYCPYPSIRRVRDDWQAVIPIKARGQVDMDIVDMPYQEDTSEIDPILIDTDEITEPLNDTSGNLVDVDMDSLRRGSNVDEEEEEAAMWQDSETEDDNDEENIDEELFVEDDDV